MTDPVLTRASVPGVDAILGKRFPVLNDGFISVIDYMGNDAAIVQAARVSYGAGTKRVSEDRTLIRFLMRMRHTSPFEMCELKLLVRVPMDCWRQWIRHRTACLTADTILQFDLPGGIERRGNQLHKLTIGEVFEKFQPTENKTRPDKQRNPYAKRDRVQQMNLRCVNEETQAVQHTQIVDVWESGEKEVWDVETESGARFGCSVDHLCLTEQGWMKLKDIVPWVDTRKSGPLDTTPGLMVTGPGRQTGVVPQFNPIDEATEEWQPIVGWEDYYAVSDQGRIRRVVGGKGSRSFGRCKQLTVSNRRAVVCLNRPDVQETKLVHRLVLAAFAGDCPPGNEACHNDGNALNNRLSNLRWDTPQSNADDRVRDEATTALQANCERIVSVVYRGYEMTYDLEVAGPWHNFSANGAIVHNSVNEYSTRYSEAIDSMQKTAPEDWRLQSKKNKQGSAEAVIEWPDGQIPYGVADGESAGEYLSKQEDGLHALSEQVYQERLALGVAREQARKDLPLSNYTEAYWGMDLHNLFHFLGLRMDSHAQLEIRSYANAIAEIVKVWVPDAWAAFEDYRLGALFLTRLDRDMVHAISRSAHDAIDLAGVFGWLHRKDDNSLKSNRERAEFEAKADRLGISIPWSQED